MICLQQSFPNKQPKKNQRLFLQVLLIPEVAARVDEEISITTTDDAQSMTPTPQASGRSWKDGKKCVSLGGSKEQRSLLKWWF